MPSRRLTGRGARRGRGGDRVADAADLVRRAAGVGRRTGAPRTRPRSDRGVRSAVCADSVAAGRALAGPTARSVTDIGLEPDRSAGRVARADLSAPEGRSPGTTSAWHLLPFEASPPRP